MNPPPSLHHVVFCVEPDNQDAAADVWRTLGFEFVEILLDDVSLRVLLDWTRGIEIISPTTSDATVCAARAFLNEQGEGVYSVVVRTEAISAATESMRSRGAELTYHTARRGRRRLYASRSAVRTGVRDADHAARADLAG